MSKKLRKPLSWLLALCMILSLLPMSVFAELPFGNHTITGKNGIISTTYYRDTVSGETTINIVVKDAAGEVIDQMTAGQTYKSATTMTIALKEAYYGVYELDNITIDQGRIYNWTGNFDDNYETTFTCDPRNGTTPTITVQLREPQNTIYLNDREGNQFGTIAYKKGINEVTIEEYLNYERVGTKTVHMAATVNNFSLNLNDGYYFDTDRMQQIKYESNVPGQTFTYNRGDGTNYNNLVIGVVAVPGLTQNRGTVKLYFFNYEDGVKVDFTRYVNGGALHLDEACKDQNIRFNYGRKDYHFVYSDWAQEDVVFLPEDTLIYVQPIIKDGYVFDYWKSADGYGDHANSLYTVVNGTLKEEAGIEGLDEGVYAFSPEMAFRCESGYDRLQIGLHMVEGDKTYYTVSYDVNGGSGSMDAQTFSEYGCFIQTNQFTKSGSEFVRWNTQLDGNGTDYAAGTFYNEKHDLKLYAIWSDGTIVPDPGDGYTITGFEKKWLSEAPEGVTLPEGTTLAKVEGNKVMIPADGTATLLYKLEVIGKAGANFTITDENATLVDYSNCDITSGNSSPFTGTITDTGDDATAILYVTKTFKVTDIKNSKLSNTAEITAGEGTELGEGVGSDTADVDAEEAAPVPPTEEQLKNLLKQAVTIHCTTAEFSHTAKPYGLLDGGYSVSPVSEEAPYKVTITVTPGAYVTQYGIDMGKEHKLNPGQPASQSITLIYDEDEKSWNVDSKIPVLYTVTCDDKTIVNSTEFHIMELGTIKEVVAEKAGKAGLSVADVQILYIGVTGTVTAAGDIGSSDETKGGVFTSRCEPDKGAPGGIWTVNGYLSKDKAWKVLNSVPTIDDDSVTGITIYYQTTDGRKTSVNVPCTEFEKIQRLSGVDSYITQIWLKEPTPTPENYTLSYNYNTGVEPETVEVDEKRYMSEQEAALKDKAGDTDNDGVVFLGWTQSENQYSKQNPVKKKVDEESLAPKLVKKVEFVNSNITVCAAWAEDANNNNIPDYKDKKITVQFKVDSSKGSFTNEGAGPVTFDNLLVGSTEVKSIPEVTGNGNYVFTGWKVEGNTTTTWTKDKRTFTAAELDARFNEGETTGHVTVSAQFQKKPDDNEGSGTIVTTKYKIDASAGKGGDISPEGTVNVNRGASKAFTITADKGYKISDVLVDGKSVGKVSSYTFKSVKEDHTIKAIFAKLPTDPDDSGTSNWLNTKDHFAYMNGYPDSTFGPNRNMTRAEVAQMFYALLLDKDVTTTVAFSDVPADAWYAKAVNTLASLGMVTGYPDGTFHPDASITRAEFATIALAFAYELKDADCNYYDVPENAWFYTYVAQATTYGWIGGSNGYFRPNDMITRAEVSVIVNNMLGRAADEDYVDKHEDDLVTFPDVKPSYWAYYSIMETVNDHEYTKQNGLEDWK